jgi:hypothetical protein
MPYGIYKRTKPVWNKGKKGLQVAWNKGISMSDSAKEKLRESLKGHIPWNKGTKGKMKAWNKGLVMKTMQGGQ